MPARTVDDAFKQFASKITPTPAQQETMNSRRAEADRVLREAFAGSNMPVTRTKLIGSAGRNTIIRPLNDVDVFAIFNDEAVWSSYRADSSKLLYRVRDALNSKYDIKVGSRGQAIRLFFKSDPQVEIVPAFAVDTGGYCIPSGQPNFIFGGYSWQMTDPYVHEKFIDRRHTELGNRLRPLIRLLKRWNAVNGKHFSSFHLELVVQQAFSSIGTSYPANTHQFFGWAPSALNVTDPAGHSGSLLGNDFFKAASMRSALKSAYERTGKALDAEEKGDHAEAIRLWGITFGDEFPVYG